MAGSVEILEVIDMLSHLFKIIRSRAKTGSCFLFIFLLTPLASPYASQLSLEDIPQPKGSSLRYTDYHGRENLKAEYWIPLQEKISHQEINDRGVEVAERYVDMMKAKRWDLKKENWQRTGGEFIFKKDILKEAKVTVGRLRKAIKGKMKSYIFIRISLKRLIPFEDNIGIDPYDVPRYPGSIRIRWMNLLGDFAVKYLVVGSSDEVKGFFEREAPKYGWETARGVGTLNYIKGGVKSPEELPQKDRTITEPLEMIKKMIPSTLSVHISEKEGIVEIGIGRSVGSADLGRVKEKPEITPPKRIEKRGKNVFPFIEVDDIPVYKGLSRKSLRKEPVKVTTGEERTRVRYEKTKAEMKEALDMAGFYLKEMKKRGWKLAEDEWYGIGRKMLFKKGAVKVRVAIKAVGRLPIPEKAPRLNIPVEVEIILPIPTRDVVGKDIEDVPRFPGSVRFYYLKVGTDHIVKFKAVASVEEVEWFFIEELQRRGWSFAGNDKTGLLFLPPGTAQSPTEAFSKGQLIPTTLKVKVDDMRDGTVKIGMDLTKGD